MNRSLFFNPMADRKLHLHCRHAGGRELACTGWAHDFPARPPCRTLKRERNFGRIFTSTPRKGQVRAEGLPTLSGDRSSVRAQRLTGPPLTAGASRVLNLLFNLSTVVTHRSPANEKNRIFPPPPPPPVGPPRDARPPFVPPPRTHARA